ncbi:DUF4259 domain-containing protein [Streptomyces sp. NPDC058572]|uniref:DUF4259 domain-containing protein n=1 Tax=Streptomyces sp. NPDC058572 TaxID=3346546 RepID=UPI00364FAC62
MGTWGSGNFQNDTAADYLAGVIKRLVTEVTDALAGDPVILEPDEFWGAVVPCNVELLYVLASSGYTPGVYPKTQEVKEWKEAFMSVWERTIDNLQPVPGFKEERRAVLHRTFDQLAEVTAER